MRTVIATIDQKGNVRTFSTLTKACAAFGFSRHTLYRMRFPIEWRGVIFTKTEIE